MNTSCSVLCFTSLLWFTALTVNNQDDACLFQKICGGVRHNMHTILFLTYCNLGAFPLSEWAKYLRLIFIFSNCHHEFIWFREYYFTRLISFWEKFGRNAFASPEFFSNFDDDDLNALVTSLKCTQNGLDLITFIQVFLSDVLSSICSWNYTDFIDWCDADCDEPELPIFFYIRYFLWVRESFVLVGVKNYLTLYLHENREEIQCKTSPEMYPNSRVTLIFFYIFQ